MIRRKLRVPVRQTHVKAPCGRSSAAPQGASQSDMVWQARITAHARGVAAALLLGFAGALAGGCSDAETIFVPTVYVVAGRVADPTQNPIAGVPSIAASIAADMVPEYKTLIEVLLP